MCEMSKRENWNMTPSTDEDKGIASFSKFHPHKHPSNHDNKSFNSGHGRSNKVCSYYNKTGHTIEVFLKKNMDYLLTSRKQVTIKPIWSRTTQKPTNILMLMDNKVLQGLLTSLQTNTKHC